MAALPWLKAEGRDIVDEDGHAVLLKGYCLGGWLNTENFINGYPFTDHLYQRALREALGAEKAEHYYAQQYAHYLTEADVAFLAECGTNAVRAPFNYRLFESDMRPGEFDGPGFELLDRLLGWCREHGLYIMLDLHSAQGWQNPDWHCDNPADVCLLWDTQDYRDRVAGLWRAIAERYEDEPVIAGYEILNEPTAPDTGTLQEFYQEVAAEIRRVDGRHIIFLEGNMWGSQFEGFEPFEDNLVYACHIYLPSDFEMTAYPNNRQNPEQMADAYRGYVEFGRRHDVPMWCSEFGAHHYTGDEEIRRGRLRTIDDQISHFEEVGHSWSMWTYKDVGVMGLAVTDPESHYMRRTAAVRELKAELGADWWTDVPHDEPHELLRPALEGVERICGERVEAGVIRKVFGRAWLDAASKVLMKPFGEQFAGMTKDEISATMESWRLENCRVNEGLVAILKKHAAPTGT
ncbi:MAG: glycoside hydrolase family 5 protein [Candidatus Brocadiia bacterium]